MLSSPLHCQQIDLLQTLCDCRGKATTDQRLAAIGTRTRKQSIVPIYTDTKVVGRRTSTKEYPSYGTLENFHLYLKGKVAEVRLMSNAHLYSCGLCSVDDMVAIRCEAAVSAHLVPLRGTVPGQGFQ